MPLNFLRTRLHGLTTILLLSYTTSQLIHAAIFTQEPETVDIVRFTTAALSLPAHLASINHPDSKFYACATHTLKTINEITSIVGTGYDNEVRPVVIGWFLSDFISIFTSLSNDTAPEKSISDGSIDGSDEATGNKQFITETRYILACIEAALRVAAALHNNAPRVWQPRPTDFDWPHENTAFTYAIENHQFLLNHFSPDTLPWNTHKLLYRCISLFRTIDLYLSEDQGLVKKILFLLLIANVYAISHQYNRTQDESFARARAQGFADGAVKTTAGIISEIDRLRNKPAQAAQTRAVMGH
jgi:hypothetical protein